jgi:hypothetical protein
MESMDRVIGFIHIQHLLPLKLHRLVLLICCLSAEVVVEVPMEAAAVEAQGVISTSPTHICLVVP